MDGKEMLRRLRQLLNEASDSRMLDNQTSYDYLYDAAKEYVRQTRCLTSYQDLTTVAEQAGYVLNGDFMGLYLQSDDEEHDFFVQYYDGTTYTMIPFRMYDEIIYNRNTTSVSIPSYFTIKEYETLDTQITGTASADGSATGGKSVLTVASDKFDNVTPGDIIHNTTDGSDGVIVSKTSAKIISTCLFGGTDNEWDTSDAFIIQPRGRMQLVFSPPPSTADHSARVWYYQRPAPVYSDYDVYRIPYDYQEALVRYAAFLYKYRDRETVFADSLYVYWKRALASHMSQINRMKNRDVCIVPRTRR